MTFTRTSEDQALLDLIQWLKVRRNLTAKETDESVRWLSYLLVPEVGTNYTDVWSDHFETFSFNSSRYSGILCFIISTLIVFILSLILALTSIRCYDVYRSRSQMPSFLYSSPPSYDTVAKIDRTELPTYQQACQRGIQKVWKCQNSTYTKVVEREARNKLWHDEVEDVVTLTPSIFTNKNCSIYKLCYSL